MSLAEFLQYTYQLEHIVASEEPECRYTRIVEMCEEMMLSLLAQHTSSFEAKSHIAELFSAATPQQQES